MTKSADLKLQMWGNSLAVRIPSDMARAAKLSPGQPVEVRLEEGVISIVPIGGRDMTLSERLALYDPSQHGGEVMVGPRAGEEAA
jgi:antitoxin MazE